MEKFPPVTRMPWMNTIELKERRMKEDSPRIKYWMFRFPKVGIDVLVFGLSAVLRGTLVKELKTMMGGRVKLGRDRSDMVL